jgi:hypothetical protein
MAMTGPGPRDHWSPSHRAAPAVRIVSGYASVPGGESLARASHRRRGANSDRVNASIVMSLLISSTSLALYDLFVLVSALAANG